MAHGTRSESHSRDTTVCIRSYRWLTYARSRRSVRVGEDLGRRTVICRARVRSRERRSGSVAERRSHRGHERGISVVVPAHNEAGVLAPTLRAVIGQTFHGTIDLVVVANGCTDETVQVARSLADEASTRGHSLRIYELEEPGKAGALNLGDRMKWFVCTMYLDADVTLSLRAIEGVYDALHGPAQVPLASPLAGGCAFELLGHARRRTRGPACPTSRGRFAVLVAMRSIGKEEAVGTNIRTCWRMTDSPVCISPLWNSGSLTTWTTPGDCLKDRCELVRVRSRWLLGNDELRKAQPHLFRQGDPRYEGLAALVLRNPVLWKDIAVFLTVYAIALGRMWLRRRAGDRSWDRAYRARSVQTATAETIELTGE